MHVINKPDSYKISKSAVLQFNMSCTNQRFVLKYGEITYLSISRIKEFLRNVVRIEMGSNVLVNECSGIKIHTVLSFNFKY